MRALPILTALTALSLLAAGCGGEEAAAPVTVTVTETETETETVTETIEAAPEANPPEQTTAPEETAQAAGVTRRRFGGTGIDEGIAFSVKGWHRASSVEQDFGDTVRAGAGATFVIVDANYTNRSNDAVDPFCGGNGSTLYDSAGRNFDMDDSTAVSIPNNTVCVDLQPGFRARATLVFKVPTSAKETSIRVWNPDGDDYDGTISSVEFKP